MESNSGTMSYVMLKTLNQFFGFKETLEVPHLPNACKEEDDRLRDGPPEHPLVGALTGHAEPLFSELQREQSSIKNTPGPTPPLTLHSTVALHLTEV